MSLPAGAGVVSTRDAAGTRQTGPVPTVRVTAADDHLARITGSNPVMGVAELVWNSLDAESSVVSVDVITNAMDSVDEVVITDDGHGFSTAEAESLFDHVGGSWKREQPNRRTLNQRRMLHGDKGEGRWRSFSIGDRTVWESVTSSGDGNRLVTVSIAAARLDQFEWRGPDPTERPVGTRVTVSAGSRRPSRLLRDDTADLLCAVFALYLKAYPDVEVSYRGNRLEPDQLILSSVEIPLDLPEEFGEATLTVLEWVKPIERGLYLCDAEGATLHVIEPGIHAPAFDFTAYISWDGFRTHESLLLMADWESEEIGPVLDAARQALRTHFRQRRDEQRRDVVQQWKEEAVYPYSSDPDTAVQQANQAIFNYVAVSAEHALNSISDPTAKRFSLNAIKVAVEADPSSLELVMKEVLALPVEKLDEFREILERTSLASVIAAVKTVTDRLEFLAGLETLIFDPTVAVETLERAHLHRILENEPWLFGEEFALHVSDRSLTSLLEAHLQALGRDDLVANQVLDEKGRHRRIDFMFGRALELNRNRREHLVVEIKRPEVVIGRQEVSQIEDYAQAVATDARFDKTTTDWDFVVVSRELDSYASGRANQKGRPHGLISQPDDSNLRIWAWTWGEIVEECKHRLKFVRNQLEFDPTGDQAVAYLRSSYPDFLPDRLARHRGEKAETDERTPTGDP